MVAEPNEFLISTAPVKADFAVARPRWALVPKETGENTFIINIASDDRCIMPCLVPTQISTTVTIYKDPAHRVAQQALSDIANGIEFTVLQDEPVRVGTPTEVTLEASIPATPQALGYDDLTFSLVGRGEDVVRDISPQNTNQVVQFPIVVTAGSQRNYDEWVSFKLEATWRGTSLKAPVSDGMRVTVFRDPWYIRLWNNLDPVVKALAIITTLVGAFAAAWRLSRRQRASRGSQGGDHAPPSETDAKAD